jgi:hypothetical protein
MFPYAKYMRGSLVHIQFRLSLLCLEVPVNSCDSSFLSVVVQ